MIKKQQFPKVHSIIFGEGLLNDAVAIILFKITFKLDVTDSKMSLISISSLLGFVYEFISVTVMSVVIGCLTGYGFLFVMRKTKFSEEYRTVIETSLFIIYGFFVVYLTELLGYSGLLSIFLFVIIQTNYARNILSSESHQTIDNLLKTGNYLCEAIAFIFLGVNSVQIINRDSFSTDVIVSLFILFSICLVRWISIGMPAFLFLCYENIKIETPEIILIWYSGLIRGAVSVALCFSFTLQNEKLRSIVVLISVFTTLFLATISSVVVRKLNFARKGVSVNPTDNSTEILISGGAMEGESEETRDSLGDAGMKGGVGLMG